MSFFDSAGQKMKPQAFLRELEQIVNSRIWASLSFKAAKVYLTILCLNKDRKPIPNNTLAEYSGLSVTKIPSSTIELSEKGLIKKSQRGKQIYYSVCALQTPEDELQHEHCQNESDEEEDGSPEAENNDNTESSSQEHDDLSEFGEDLEFCRIMRRIGILPKRKSSRDSKNWSTPANSGWKHCQNESD